MAALTAVLLRLISRLLTRLTRTLMHSATTGEVHARMLLIVVSELAVESAQKKQKSIQLRS